MVGNMLRDPKARGFGLGLGVALLGYFLWPTLKQTMRPAARGLVKGAIITAHRTGRVIAEAREELEDLFAEARYEAQATDLGMALAPEQLGALGAPPDPAPPAFAPTPAVIDHVPVE